MGVTATTNNIFPQSTPDLIGNYIIVDDIDKLPEPTAGVVVLESGSDIDITYEIVDNQITGLPPVFVDPLLVADGKNVVLQAPRTNHPIIYTGTGAFIRSNNHNFFIQKDIIFSTPTAVLYDLKGTPGQSIVFINNMFYSGLGLGSFGILSQLFIDSGTILDWTTGFSIKNVSAVTYINSLSANSPSGSGPLLTISGEDVDQVVIGANNPLSLPGQSFVQISPDVSDNAIINIGDNTFNSVFGGDFFATGIEDTIISAADNSETGSILSFAANGIGVTTVTTTAVLPVSIVDTRKLTISVSTSYNDTFDIFNVSSSSFDIAVAFVADDATGTWDFNSVIFTTGTAHTLSDGIAVQISKSFTDYNKGRLIFDASGSVFSLDNIIFQSPGGVLTGKWTTSLDQDNSRMNVVGNGDQSDTAQILSASITTPVGLGITTINTPVDITPWVVSNDRQWTLNAPGEDIGSFRFDGKNSTGSVDMIVSGEMSTGSGALIDFILLRKPAGGIYAQVGAKFPTSFTNKALSFPVKFNGLQISTSDVFKLQAENLESGADLNILFASLDPEILAKGF